MGTDNTDTGLVPLPQTHSDQSVGIALPYYMFVLWGICQQLDHMHPYASVCCNSPRAADDTIPRLPQLTKLLWSQWASMAEAARLAVHDSLKVHDVLMQKVHRVVSTRHGCVS